MLPTQVTIIGACATTTLPLPSHGRICIGRATTNDLCLNDPAVSRAHAVLHLGSQLRIEDLGSSNGLRITSVHPTGDTARTTTRYIAPRNSAELNVGDNVLIGATIVVFGYAGAAPVRTTCLASRRGQPLVDPIVQDEKMRRLHEQMELVASSLINVLILGETGVGKEVMAELIHQRSRRSMGPFISLNCAALPEALLESELFGHEAGSFTGAQRAKPGLLELADTGTVFLDEVAELPMGIQAKLLRVLEERKVLRVGGLEKRLIDVRIVSATNRPLEEAARERTFRPDLFYRLNGLPLVIPPLRDRSSEIEPLAGRFISISARQLGLPGEPRLSDQALAALNAYQWPGNIRELRNVMERAVVLCAGDTIFPQHLGLSHGRATPPPSRPVRVDMVENSPLVPLRVPSGEAERLRILEALARCSGNQTQAAEMLGISRRTLSSKLDLYRIPRPRKKDVG